MERFVDSDENPIPAKDTWNQLTPSQLIDTRNRLVDQAYYFRQNKQIAKLLNESIKQIEALISSRETF